MIDLTDIDSAAAALNYAGSANIGVLSVTDGALTGEVYLSGSNLTAGSFHVSSDSHGGAIIALSR